MTRQAQASSQAHEPLFREQAARSARYRWFGQVRIITPPGWRLAMLIAAVATGLLALATIFAEIPDRVQAAGMLLPSDGLLKIRAPRPGRVIALFVENGAELEAGAPILQISDDQHSPGEVPEVESRIGSLERELQAQSRATDRETRAARSRLQHNRDRQAIIARRIAAVNDELSARRSQLDVQEKKAEQLARLADSGVVPRQLADEARLEALQAAATNQTVRQKLLELEEKRLLVELQLEDDRARVSTLRDRARATAETIMRQIEADRLRSSTELVAARDGIVSGLAVGRGQLVQRGEVLATLHDPQSSLEARIYLPPGSAGRIAVGQRVELALHAYPKETHGTFSAVVHSISPAAIPASEVVPGAGPGGSVFELRATLEQSARELRDGQWQLPAGSTFSADIIRERWPLYRWLWRAVNRGNATS